MVRIPLHFWTNYDLLNTLFNFEIDPSNIISTFINKIDKTCWLQCRISVIKVRNNWLYFERNYQVLEMVSSRIKVSLPLFSCSICLSFLPLSFPGRSWFQLNSKTVPRYKNNNFEDEPEMKLAKWTKNHCFNFIFFICLKFNFWWNISWQQGRIWLIHLEAVLFC